MVFFSHFLVKLCSMFFLVRKNTLKEVDSKVGEGSNRRIDLRFTSQISSVCDLEELHGGTKHRCKQYGYGYGYRNPQPLKQPYKVLSTSKLGTVPCFGEYSQCCQSTMSSSHKVQVYIAFVSSLRGNILYIIVNHRAMKILEYFEYGNGPAKKYR